MNGAGGIDWIHLAVDSCKHSNEPHNSTKYAIFHDQLSDYQLLKEDVVPWTQSTSESYSQPVQLHLHNHSLSFVQHTFQ